MPAASSLSRRATPAVPRGRAWLACGLLQLGLAATASALDGRKAITQYVHNVWTEQSGLTQRGVRAICQTRDGYIWLGTEDGVVRFNGVAFTTFNSRNTSGIGYNYISALAEDAEGTLWVGTQGGGLSRFQNGSFTAFTVADGLADDRVRATLVSRDGGLWIAGGGNGLTRLKDGRFTPFTTKDGLSSNLTRVLLEGRDGSLWVGTDGGGLNRLAGGRVTVYSQKDGLPSTSVRALWEDADGTLWIGTQGGLARLREGRFTSYTTKEGLPHAYVQAILRDRHGNLWLGTLGGLIRFDGRRFSAYASVHGLSDDAVTSLYEDKEGSLWIGTGAGGLNRLRDGAVTTYDRMEGLAANMVRAVIQARNGATWVGTDGGGLSKLEDDGFSHVTATDGLSSNEVRALADASDGSIWVGTNVGLNRVRGGTIKVYSIQHGLGNGYIRAVREDSRGTLWVGTYGAGLYRLEGERFVREAAAARLANAIVDSIYETRDGSLWIATERGLARIQAGRLDLYGRGGGLLGDIVTGLHEDADGTLWITTNPGGLNRFKDGRWAAYTLRDGLFHDQIHALLEDGEERLWMSCDRGLFWVSKSELNAFAEGRASAITSHAFGGADGLKTPEANGGSPAAWKGADGRLWFATMRGVAVVDPRIVRRNETPPPVLIEHVQADGRTVEAAVDPRVPPGRGSLEFRYAGLSYSVPERVLFKYRLEGFDREWVDAGQRRTAYYTNIPPGRYRFQVMACNEDGFWSESPASMSLTIEPHFHQTRWFRLLLLAGVVGGAFALHRQRLSYLRARQAELTRTVAEAVAQLKVLSGLLPICAWCKRIRDDTGYWSQIETYIHEHSGAEFTHGICPDCVSQMARSKARTDAPGGPANE